MNRLLLSIVMLMFVLASADVNAQSTVAGTWKTVADSGKDKGKDKSHVEIFEEGGVYSGKIVKLLLKPQDSVCENCKDDLKGKPLMGMVIIQNMKKTGDVDSDLGEEYAGGTILDPENGKTYKCKFWLKGDVLSLRGYIGFLFRTQRWSRVK